MTTIFIILLLLIGALLMVAEILLLPGITLAAIGSIISFGGAIYLGYSALGFNAAIVLLIISIAISIVSLFFSMRAKSLKKISLNSKIESKVAQNSENFAEIGSEAISLTRLAPMGSIKIEGNTFEAKSIDGFIDQKTRVRIVGFENSIVVVEKLK